MSYRWSDIFCLPTQRSLLAARVTLVFTMTHVMNKKVTDYKSKPRILQKQKIKLSIVLDLIVDSIFEIDEIRLLLQDNLCDKVYSIFVMHELKILKNTNPQYNKNTLSNICTWICSWIELLSFKKIRFLMKLDKLIASIT